jgi:hypothetical protein
LVLTLLAALLFAPGLAGAQCCGDCDGNGQVSINELITAVNNALGQCNAGPTPTPTVLATDHCPINFQDDNTQPGTADCYYIGRWNQACGAADLESLWRSDGGVVIVNLLGFTPGLFIGADVTGANTATIIGWFTQPDASDLTTLAGSITLGTNGTTLAVDPSTSPFDIERCAFDHYRGNIEDVVVPAALRAARAAAVDPAALTRLRAASEQRRLNFRRQ